MINVNHIPLNSKNFPDNSLCLKMPAELVKLTPKDEIIITWQYENDAELFTIICLAKKYKKNQKTLYMPYMPHARMDRVKNPDSEVFTLKYFCEIINDLDFDSVIVMDVHSNVSTALLDNCTNLNIIEELAWTINNAKSKDKDHELVLFFPDEGSVKRYAEDAGMPYAYGIKHRDWNTGIITSLEVHSDFNLAGKNVLIVDDICSYGGTFFNAAKKLKAVHGVNKVFLYVTHCEQNILRGNIYREENKGLIEGVYTTTSLPALGKEVSLFPIDEGYPWIEFI